MSMRALLAFLLLFGVQNVAAQYPQHAIKLIVPFPRAGRPTSRAHRGAETGRRPARPDRGGGEPAGRGRDIGSDSPAERADGYTLLFASTTSLSIAPVLQKLPVRPDPRFCAGHPGREHPERAGGEPEAAGEGPARAGGARRGPARKAQLFLERHRQHRSSQRRAVQDDRQGQHGARALQRYAARDSRPRQRQRGDDGRQPGERAAQHPLG